MRRHRKRGKSEGESAVATINAARQQRPRNDGSVGSGPISTLAAAAADAQCSKFSRRRKRRKKEENERVGLGRREEEEEWEFEMAAVKSF